MSRKIVVSVDQLARPQPGGIASYVRGLLRGLRELDGPDEIVALGPLGALRHSGHDGATAVVPFSESLTPRLWRWAALGVPRNADIVHATSMAGPFGGARVLQTAALHDLLWRDEASATTRRGARFHEQRLRLLLRRTDIRLLTSSPLLPARLIELGVSPERIFPIRLGVDDGGVQPASPETVRDLLLRFGITGPFTLHAGTREPRKNTHSLVEAHRLARRHRPELGPLVFVGPPGWGEVTTGDAVVLGSVPRDALLGLYRDASVVAYVPRAEGFGLPPVEALRAGTRVVASANCPSVVSNPEVVHVDPLDIDAIAAGLQHALDQSTDDAAKVRRRASVAELTWRNSALDHLAAWQ